MRNDFLTGAWLVLLLVAAAPTLAGASAAPPVKNELGSSLLDAADKGDVRAMGALLERGARIDAVDIWTARPRC